MSVLLITSLYEPSVGGIQLLAKSIKEYLNSQGMICDVLTTKITERKKRNDIIAIDIEKDEESILNAIKQIYETNKYTSIVIFGHTYFFFKVCYTNE